MERIIEIEETLEKVKNDPHFNMVPYVYHVKYLLAENKRLTEENEHLQDAYDEWHPLGNKEELMKRRIIRSVQALKQE